MTSWPESAATLCPVPWCMKIFFSSSNIYFTKIKRYAQSIDPTLWEQEKVVSLGGRQLLSKNESQAVWLGSCWRGAGLHKHSHCASLCFASGAARSGRRWQPKWQSCDTGCSIEWQHLGSQLGQGPTEQTHGDSLWEGRHGGSRAAA